MAIPVAPTFRYVIQSICFVSYGIMAILAAVEVYLWFMVYRGGDLKGWLRRGWRREIRNIGGYFYVLLFIGLIQQYGRDPSFADDLEVRVVGSLAL
jgi:hypothetical protein